jgi:hypothetical protein
MIRGHSLPVEATMSTLRVSLGLGLSVMIHSCVSAQQFFSDGKTIGGWTRYDEYGLDETYHFGMPVRGQTFWNQQIAVRYHKQPNRIYFYDHLVSRTFKGFYDESEGRYFNLPDQYRRPRIEEIREEWFQPLDDMPFLRNMFRNQCERPFPEGSPALKGAERLEEPPSPPALPGK